MPRTLLWSIMVLGGRVAKLCRTVRFIPKHLAELPLGYDNLVFKIPSIIFAMHLRLHFSWTLSAVSRPKDLSTCCRIPYLALPSKLLQRTWLCNGSSLISCYFWFHVLVGHLDSWQIFFSWLQVVYKLVPGPRC